MHGCETRHRAKSESRKKKRKKRNDKKQKSDIFIKHKESILRNHTTAKIKYSSLPLASPLLHYTLKVKTTWISDDILIYPYPHRLTGVFIEYRYIYLYICLNTYTKLDWTEHI